MRRYSQARTLVNLASPTPEVPVVFPFPSPTFSRSKGAEVDDSDTFPSPRPLTPDYATNQWTVGTQGGVADAQLPFVAEGLERLLQQDFSAGYFTAYLVPPLAGRPAIPITLTVTAGVPSALVVGSQAPFNALESAGMADSIRALPGHGTRWTPA